MPQDIKTHNNQRQSKKTGVTCFKRPCGHQQPPPTYYNKRAVHHALTITGYRDGPRATTLTCLRGAFRIMENTHDAVWVKCLQKPTPVIILILPMPDGERAEILKSCRTTSRLIEGRSNDSSNIYIWHEEPLSIKLDLSGWGFHQ